MRTVDDLMSEFGAALQFFGGFGENWPALVECLSYLDEWLPADAYVLIVERSEEVLADEPADLPALMSAIDSAGRSFSVPVTSPERFTRPAIPFHALFNFSPGADVELDRLLHAAASRGIAIAVDREP